MATIDCGGAGENRTLHRYVPPSQCSDISSNSGSDVAPKGVWKFVKQLRGDHVECFKPDSDKTKKTHCCLYSDENGTCYQLLRLCRHKDNGSWNTAEALVHFKLSHPQSELGGKQNGKEKRKLEQSAKHVDNSTAAQEAKKQAMEEEGEKEASATVERVSVSPEQKPKQAGEECFVSDIKRLCLARNDKDRLSWHEYFASMSILASARSPCERLHVGCVIVRENRMLSMGFNGFFSGAPHKSIMKDGHEQATVHAEQNAISHAARVGISLRDSCAYITHFPCVNCYKSLVAAGIARVYYIDDYRNDRVVFELSKVSGVTVDKVTGLR